MPLVFFPSILLYNLYSSLFLWPKVGILGHMSKFDSIFLMRKNMSKTDQRASKCLQRSQKQCWIKLYLKFGLKMDQYYNQTLEDIISSLYYFFEDIDIFYIMFPTVQFRVRVNWRIHNNGQDQNHKFRHVHFYK
jgi:hypothetical protein